MEHYHKWEVIKEGETGVKEVCVECGKVMITTKQNGRILDPNYLKEHIRDTAQPFGRTKKIFDQYYGNKAD